MNRITLAVLAALSAPAFAEEVEFADPSARIEADAPNLKPTLSYHPKAKFQSPLKSKAAAAPSQAKKANAAVTGFYTLPNFTGSYSVSGYDYNGNQQTEWKYAYVGNDPSAGGTTTVGHRLVPVNVQLLGPNGKPAHDKQTGALLLAKLSDSSLSAALNSPILQNATYTSSSVDTQWGDALNRATFFYSAPKNWHTLLSNITRPTRTINVPSGTYSYKLKSDNTCCDHIFVNGDTLDSLLVPQFDHATNYWKPLDETTTLGDVYLHNQTSPQRITTFLLPDVFELSSKGQCCGLGYHSIVARPPNATSNGNDRVFVYETVAWITTSIFGSSLTGSEVWSHEIAEIFADPFVTENGYNTTPWWISPNGNCQDNLEVGDVIEGLSNAVTQITINGTAYNMQNEALLPWFKYKTHSGSIDHAYSYPDTSVLSTPIPQNYPVLDNPNCQ